jgi:hypothetical protein
MRRVPVPREGRAPHDNVMDRLAPDLREDPSFALNSLMYGIFGPLESAARCRSGFLSDDAYDYGPARQ